MKSSIYCEICGGLIKGNRRKKYCSDECYKDKTKCHLNFYMPVMKQVYANEKILNMIDELREDNPIEVDPKNISVDIDNPYARESHRLVYPVDKLFKGSLFIRYYESQYKLKEEILVTK